MDPLSTGPPSRCVCVCVCLGPLLLLFAASMVAHGRNIGGFFVGHQWHFGAMHTDQRKNQHLDQSRAELLRCQELATGTISIRGPFDDTVLQTLGLRQNGMNWFDEVTEVLVLGLQVLALGRSFKCSGQ